jgi:hypothetical protein
MKVLLLTIAFSIVMISCAVFDPEEIQPAYIKLGEIKVYEPGTSDIYTTHDVRDIWVYMDGTALGVFPSPGHVPVIPGNPDENSIIQMLAGIRDNGIASYLTIYPFLEFFEMDQKIIPGSIYQVNPVYKYRSNTILRFNEGIEHSSHLFSLDLDNNQETKIIGTTSNKKTGENSGHLYVNKTNPVLEAANNIALLNLPINASSVYLELDYLADHDFNFGMIGYDETTGSQGIKSYYLGLKKNTSWQKIYINVTEELAASKFDAYRFFFSLQLNQDKEAGNVYLDNIKLLHF